MKQTATETLVELLDEAVREGRATVTFSQHCHSGLTSLISKDYRCICWRCKGERGEAWTEETEKDAKDISQALQSIQRRRTIAWFNKNRGEVPVQTEVEAGKPTE